MKKYTLLLMTACSALFSQSISYEELKASALKHSHILKIRNTDTAIETARLDGVVSALYPKISLGYNSEYSKNLDDASLGNISVGESTINSNTLYKNSLALHLNYELYNFGTTLKRIDMSKKEIFIKELEVCHEEIKLFLELLEHYGNVQKSQNALYYQREMLRLHKELYTLKQRLYTAGSESRISVGDEAIAIIALEHTIQEETLKYNEELLALSKASYVTLDPDSVVLMELTKMQTSNAPLQFDTTPQAHQYVDKLSQKEDEISLITRMQFPVISLYSNYYLYGDDKDRFQSSIQNIRSNSWNGGINIRLGLFEGFKYNSEAKRLRLEKQRLLEEYEYSKREYEYETKIKLDHLDRLEQLSTLENEAILEAKQKTVMTKKLRLNGEADALSDLGAQLEALNKEMIYAKDKIQMAYEKKSLEILATKVEECNQP